SPGSHEEPCEDHAEMRLGACRLGVELLLGTLVVLGDSDGVIAVEPTPQHHRAMAAARPDSLENGGGVVVGPVEQPPLAVLLDHVEVPRARVPLAVAGCRHGELSRL